MPAVTYKCPACGGPLAYDPASKRFACDFCHSQYEESQLTRSAVEAPDASQETVSYSCPSCGAQVVTSKTTAATFCYFCHNPVVLEGRVSDEWKPDAVLPFEITKEQACDRFLKWAKKKRFVPRGFSLRESIENISGVYYPYWVSQVELDAAFDGNGQQVSVITTAHHIVTTTKHYHVVRKGRLTFQNIFRSALSTADRTLADGVQPYRAGGMQPFTPKYLAGFLAEKRDIDNKTIQPSLLSEAEGYADGLVRPSGLYDALTGSTSVSNAACHHQYVLLPAWVITYKGPRGEVESYIVNGQSGSACGRLPVSLLRLAGGWGIISGVLFLLLCVGGYFLW